MVTGPGFVSPLTLELEAGEAGISRKGRGFTVRTEKPSESAVAPMSRSPMGTVTPLACCSPSIRPAWRFLLCMDRQSDRGVVRQ
jgi:hypothetical protein